MAPDPNGGETHMNKFTMARGDLYAIPFGIYIDNVLSTEAMDEIYFTVKKNYQDKDFVFQKTVTGGGIATDGQGNYVVKILPEDTNELSVGSYDFDFEIVKMPSIKRTFAGTLELTREVTHWYNEGV